LIFSVSHRLIISAFLLVIGTVGADLFAEPDVTVENVTYGKSQNLIFQAPSSIYYDTRKAEIYVTDSGNASVLIFNSQGSFLFSFRHWVKRDGRVIPGEPRDIVVSGRGYMYLTDALSREIDIISVRGEKIETIDPGDYKPYRDKVVYPQYMAIDPADTLYVTIDGDVKEVLVLDPELRFVRSITGTGGGFGVLTGIALDESGRVLVTDIEGPECVQVYSRAGEFLFGFGVKAIGDENFSHPHGLAVTSEGDIWVVDSFRQVVKRFTRDGTFKEMVGGFGFRPGDQQYPIGIDSDQKDRIFVAEKVGRRFQILRAH